ncbi:MAG: hypothetical protein NVS4B11_03890 [Ktedonobacteraceae bacterium]
MALRKKDFDESNKHSPSLNQTDLILHISAELQRKINVAALQNYLSLEEYVEQVLEQATSKDDVTTRHQDKPLSPEIVGHVLEVSEQIKQHTRGHLFEDSTEMIRQMREERSQELDQR